MPRRPCLAVGELTYHVLNRRVGRLPLFEKPADYTAYKKILAEAHAQTKIRIAAYCLKNILDQILYRASHSITHSSPGSPTSPYLS